MGVLGLLALVALAAQLWHRDARRNVVVHIQVINDDEYVFVNCQEAGRLSAVGRGSDGQPLAVPLGWLSPDDRITFAVFNRVGRDYVADFRATSNGDPFGEVSIGDLGQAPAGGPPCRC